MTYKTKSNKRTESQGHRQQINGYKMEGGGKRGSKAVEI